MIKQFLFLIILWGVLSSFSDKKLPHTVYHSYETSISLADEKKFTYEVKYTMTVLNSNGKNNLSVSIFQNEGIKLESASIIYKTNGKVEKKMSAKDMVKQIVNSEMASSSYYYVAGYSALSYPVEVEVSYKVKYSNFVNLPIFSVISSDEELCEKAKVYVETPASLPLSYLAKNALFTQKIDNLSNGKKLYTFEANNLKLENYEVGQQFDIPILLLNIPRFVYYGLPGSNESFESLSNFFWELWKTETTLPAEHITFLQEITKNASSDREKTKIVYEYLQNNFRYISIQLGIGGFKPYSAASTLKNKYGDCKALTNYMHSALKALDIESYPVIIYAGGDIPFIMTEDFVFDYSNHIILTVPNKGDTIWLECTSKTSEFGNLGYFTENRTGFPIMEKGGRLIHTPKSVPQSSLLNINTVITLNEEAGADIVHHISATGDVSQLIRPRLHGTKSQVSNLLINELHWAQPRTLNVIKKEKNQLAEIQMQIDNLSKTKTPDKIFLDLYPYHFFAEDIKSNESRKKDLVIQFPFIESDTITYKLPKNYKLMSKPADVSIDSKYISFNSQRVYDEENNTLYVYTQYSIKEKVIPAKDFNDFQRTNTEVLVSRSGQMILQKQ